MRRFAGAALVGFRCRGEFSPTGFAAPAAFRRFFTQEA